MGLAATQARYLGLTARKTNIEYEGQQVNQARTALANEGANLYNKLYSLNDMKKSGYKNVTVISIGDDMASKFGDKFLVINPGNLMENHHVTRNILLSGIIEYAND